MDVAEVCGAILAKARSKWPSATLSKTEDFESGDIRVAIKRTDEDNLVVQIVDRVHKFSSTEEVLATLEKDGWLEWLEAEGCLRVGASEGGPVWRAC